KLLALPKDGPDDAIGHVAEGEGNPHGNEPHRLEEHELQAMGLAALDVVAFAHAQDAAQNPRFVNGLEEENAPTLSQEARDVRKAPIEFAHVGAGDGEAADDEGNVEATEELLVGFGEDVVLPIVDVEALGFALRRLDGEGREIQARDLGSLLGEVPARAPGTARDVDDLEAAHVAEEPVDDLHLPGIPMAIEDVAGPATARKAFVDLGLH